MAIAEDDERVFALVKDEAGEWHVLPFVVGEDRLYVRDARRMGEPTVIEFEGKQYNAWRLRGAPEYCYAAVIGE